MADTPDLGSGAERRGGSSPLVRTILAIPFIIKVFVSFYEKEEASA